MGALIFVWVLVGVRLPFAAHPSRTLVKDFPKQLKTTDKRAIFLFSLLGLWELVSEKKTLLFWRELQEPHLGFGCDFVFV